MFAILPSHHHTLLLSGRQEFDPVRDAEQPDQLTEPTDRMIIVRGGDKSDARPPVAGGRWGSDSRCVLVIYMG